MEAEKFYKIGTAIIMVMVAVGMLALALFLAGEKSQEDKAFEDCFYFCIDFIYVTDKTLMNITLDYWYPGDLDDCMRWCLGEDE